MCETKPKRRWFRFSRQKLFALVIVLTIPLVWFGWQARIVAERKAVKAMLKERNLGLDGLPGFVPFDQVPHLPWYRTLLGDSTTAGIYLNGKAFSEDELHRIATAYPEIKFAVVNVPQPYEIH